MSEIQYEQINMFDTQVHPVCFVNTRGPSVQSFFCTEATLALWEKWARQFPDTFKVRIDENGTYHVFLY